jgi:glutamine cyclotransferase
MYSSFSFSSVDVEETKGENADKMNKATNSKGILDSLLLSMSDNPLTPRIYVIKWVKKLILTSMEHCSYIYDKYNPKRSFLIIFISMLVSCNSVLFPYVSASSSDFNMLQIISHDEDSFTQGLEIKNGRLFESTGLYGYSSLREINISSGEVIRQVSFNDSIFAEGITIVENSIVMLTWKENIALVFDIETFEIINNYSEDGKKITNINELECVGDSIYANIWGENRIISINMSSGIVEMSFHMDSLEFIQNNSNSVLNGIAYSAPDDAFWITGKYWSNMYLTDFSINESTHLEVIDDKEEHNLLDLPFKFLSIVVLIVFAIFVLPGSWPAITFLFLRLFMRQTEHLGSSGNDEEGEEIN